METIPLYLSLGSNVGDRKMNIKQALGMLDDAFPGARTALSEVLEFPSWGFDSADFLNCVARYSLPSAGQSPLLHGLCILETCKRIERSLGRQEDLRFDGNGRRIYGDRPIDIDILFYGCDRIDTDRLTVPHKLMRERDFVMVPLRQIAESDVIASFPEIFNFK